MPIIKIAVLGKEESGKTELILRFLRRVIVTKQSGLNGQIASMSCTWKVDKESYEVIGWEFKEADQQLRGAQGILLAIDITDRDCANNLKKLLSDVASSRPTPAPIVIVGTKNDLNEEKYYDKNIAAIRAIASEHNIEFVLTGINKKDEKDFTSDEQAFGTLISKIINCGKKFKPETPAKKTNETASLDDYNAAYGDLLRAIIEKRASSDPKVTSAADKATEILAEANKLYNTDKFKKISAELIETIKEAAELLKNPTADKIAAFKAKAAIAEGHSSVWKKVVGAVIILAGLVVMGLAVAASLHTAGLSLPTLGLSGAATIAVGAAMVGATGITTAIASTALFFSGRQKSLSEAMDRVADAAAAIELENMASSSSSSSSSSKSGK